MAVSRVMWFGAKPYRLSFICPSCCHAGIAAYPSAMGEQPFDADILGLATHRWYGTLCRHNAR